MRKVETVRVPADGFGRDAGKLFRITEMSANQAEKWAVRALLLLAGSGGEIPESVIGMGMEGIALTGINVFLRSPIQYEKLEPLLDEMMTCVQVVRDSRTPDVATAIASPDDIEEVATRAWLRGEVLRIHTGFSAAAALSALISKIMTPPNTSTM